MGLDFKARLAYRLTFPKHPSRRKYFALPDSCWHGRWGRGATFWNQFARTAQEIGLGWENALSIMPVFAAIALNMKNFKHWTLFHFTDDTNIYYPLWLTFIYWSWNWRKKTIYQLCVSILRRDVFCQSLNFLT